MYPKIKSNRQTDGQTKTVNCEKKKKNIIKKALLIVDLCELKGKKSYLMSSH